MNKKWLSVCLVFDLFLLIVALFLKYFYYIFITGRLERNVQHLTEFLSLFGLEFNLKCVENVLMVDQGIWYVLLLAILVAVICIILLLRNK